MSEILRQRKVSSGMGRLTQAAAFAANYTAAGWGTFPTCSQKTLYAPQVHVRVERVLKKVLGCTAVGYAPQEHDLIDVSIPRNELSWAQSGGSSLEQDTSTDFFHALG